MSGIPIYTHSPITAAKANAPTPQTASPTSHTTPAAPSYNPANPSSTSPYAPQPGQRAVPAPTGSLAAPMGPAHNYIPSPTTPTTTTAQYPPPPQPGAVPTPPGRAKNPLPPPPKVGEKFIAPVPAAQAETTPYPPQMGYAPPAKSYQPTMAGSPRVGNYPTTLPVQGLGAGGGEVGRKSFEHPPGYQQNPYGGNMNGPQGGQSGQWHHAGAMGDSASEETSIWETTKKWAYSAGEKMAETEAEIWKKVNGEK